MPTAKKTAKKVTKTQKSATKKPTVKAAKISHSTAKTKTVPVSKLAAALQQAKTTGITPSTVVVSGRSAMTNKLLIAAWILVIAGALYYFRGQFIVATVNGQPIFRSALIKELEAQSGPQVLDNMILETLVRQEAANRKITITDQEITDETKKLETKLAAQKQNLDQLLAVQGMTRDMLKEQLKLQLMVEKMIDKSSVTVTDAEVKKYLDDNKAFLPKNVKPEELAPQVRLQLEQQKTTAKTQEFFKNLQTKAKVNHWLFPNAVTAPLSADQAI